MKFETGKPIKFVGVGEKIDDLRQRLNITEEDALEIIGYLQRKTKNK